MELEGPNMHLDLAMADFLPIWPNEKMGSCHVFAKKKS